ncbi:MAG: fumarylacetoacetate hydrolase family protein [Alcanivoracaceae bacterium]
MKYVHRWIDGSAIDLPVGKVVCVGRNYAEHARELGNEVPDAPILFIKPASSLVSMAPSFSIPTDQGEVHHEIEMALLVSERLQNVDALTAQWSMAGFGLGLDLTLRDLQSELKKKGHPWERAKAFDGACPVSGFIDARGVSWKQPIEISLEVNGELRQRGNTTQMLFPVFQLVAQMSKVFTLEPGDIILAGTPSGVAALQPGDQLVATFGNTLKVSTAVTARTDTEEVAGNEIRERW